MVPNAGPAALAGVAQGIKRPPVNRGSLVQSPVRAYAWVVGQVPSWLCAKGNWSMYLSHIDVALLFSLSYALKINTVFFEL